MMSRPWLRQLLAILSILAFSMAINRPVYKIVLNSKGYAQFIQYDVDSPPLREFTLCVWVRVTSVESDQSIFTYVGNDDKRIMRLWLDSGGQQMRISLDHGRVVSSVAVEFTAGVWRDVCLSYQADYGAWALYLDAQLVLCEASRKIQGFEFPGEGRLILGYGTSDKGSPTGLSGEIYGASMILYSTIERNTTIRKQLWNTKKNQKNRITENHKPDNKYIVLEDLPTYEQKNVMPTNVDEDHEDLTVQQPQENIKVITGYHTLVSTTKNKPTHDFPMDAYHQSSDKDNNKYLNPIYKDDVLKVRREFKKELTGSGTRDLPIVLEYETPPPLTASTVDYFTNKNSDKLQNLAEDQNDDIKISDVEQPPPLEHNNKVYGQWTHSKFVSNVLNYLKSINFNTHKKQKKVLMKFPLVKLSDSYPYPSELIYDKIRPPKNYKKIIHREKRHNIKIRDVNGQQINVEILDSDASNNMNPSKYPNPNLVEVTNRGEAKKQLTSKPHRSAENTALFESEEKYSIIPSSFKKRQLDATLNIAERHRGNNFMGILPFLKSKEYFVNKQNAKTKNTETNRVYTKSLSNTNKWHNVKFFDNDYTSRLITDIEYHAKPADSVNTTLPPFTKSGFNKQVLVNNFDTIINGRALAKEVSNQAKKNYYNVPLLKFKHGFLPSHDTETKTSNNLSLGVREHSEDTKMNSQNHFNKHVKLGNALNEQFIIGFDEHQIKNTFLGGDDTIPDINRHRSKWNTKSKMEDIPPSLGVRVCKNIELYVQEDESIGRSKILSPLERRNIGIEFILQSYKKCSTKELKDRSLLLIDWIKTPVKLFGGAYPKKTKDLCGFF